MSFGFSIGDFIAVGKLSMSVYRSCRDAPESFGNISMEVLSLHAVLTEVEEVVSAQDMSPTRQNNLMVISRGCEGVLKDIQALVLKYESLGTQSKRTWDRMKWGMNDIAELRSRLTSNTVLLTAFMSTCQVVVERKLNKLAREFQDGKHEGSVMTTVTVASLTQDDQETWREIRKEFENIGISVAAFDANRLFILEWCQKAMASGAFTESEPSALENTDSETESLRSVHSSHAITPDEDTDLPTDPPNSGEAKSASFDQRKLQPQPTYAGGQSEPQSQFIKPLNQGLTITAQGTRNQAMRKTAKKRPRIISLVSWVLRYDGAFPDAMRNGDFIGAQKYLSQGANIDAESSTTGTALHDAIKTSNKAAVKWLLAHGANPNLKGVASLATVFKLGGPFMFEIAQLLIDNGTNINKYDMVRLSETFMQCAALHVAIEKSDTAAVAWLLDRGADSGIPQHRLTESHLDDKLGFHLAVLKDALEIAQLLLDKGENINVRNWRNKTALHLVADMNKPELALWLLERGAEVDLKDLHGKTPLFHAALHNSIDVAKLLLDRGASSIPAFRKLLQLGHDDLGREFLLYGVRFRDVHKEGNTLLHDAARGDCAMSFRDLIDLGLDSNAKNSRGECPWVLSPMGGRVRSFLLVGS